MVKVRTGDLKEYATEIFRKLGANIVNARIVANHLISANMEGHDSHGVIRIKQYAGAISKGLLVPNAEPEVVKETANTLLINGNRGFGQVVMEDVVKKALSKMMKNDLCMISVYNVNHVGRMCDTVVPLAQQGYLAFVFCNGGGPNTTAYGSRQRIFSTNPFAIAMPDKKGVFVADFASAASAEGKLRIARANHEKVEDFQIIDFNGLPTNNPEDFYDGGAILPMGKHKGSAFSLSIEILAGILTGGGCATFPGWIDGNNVTLFVVKADIFRSLDAFKEDLDRMKSIIKKSIPATGVDEVLLPGEKESRAREKNTKYINLDEGSYQSMIETAKSLGMKELEE